MISSTAVTRTQSRQNNNNYSDWWSGVSKC